MKKVTTRCMIYVYGRKRRRGENEAIIVRE
jgi:hypothetical protein